MQSPTRRLWVLSIIVILAFAGLTARLVNLQILRFDYYQAIASSQRQQASQLAPRRGTIYMQENNSQELFPIAVNSKAWIAYAVPRDIYDPLSVAKELAPAIQSYRDRQKERVQNIINTTGQQSQDEESIPAELSTDDKVAILEDELYKKLNQKADPYEPLLRFYENIDKELKQFLEQRSINGIVLQEQEIRTYPEKTLAAHTIGYVGWQDSQKTGRYGIEEYFEKDLAGSLGFFASERDASGKLIGVGANELKPAQDGADVVLTIDRVVQSIIEDVVKDGVTRYGAERGSVIVMDPKTSAILGMATYPTYDPNYYYAINDAQVQLNPVISEIFEPGSILKPVIMASAINESIVEADTTFNDNGPISVAEYNINTYDGKHHGVQTMTQVLEKSNNVGMVWVGQQIGAETMYDYLRRFGLGEKTGIKLSGETQNMLKEPDDWDITTIATTSFGQGIALTPLQALNSINVLANDGILMQPHIVSRTRQDNNEEKITQATAVRHIISSTTAEEVSAMMVSVIENGVAQLARVPGYYLAGKTGTAQVPDEKGKYSADRKIISFVGYGPVENPRFSILIKLDNPSGLSFASGTAAPMFRDIASKLLNYYHVPPDYDVNKPLPEKIPFGQPENRGA
jgi:cell division protein FtsI/penicillin-binding protein 2